MASPIFCPFSSESVIATAVGPAPLQKTKRDSQVSVGKASVGFELRSGNALTEGEEQGRKLPLETFQEVHRQTLSC
jgi:hypothetical protein